MIGPRTLGNLSLDFLTSGLQKSYLVCLAYHILYSSGPARKGHATPSPPQLFCVAKRKKLNKGKKGKSFKPETIKRLPPKSKCYCFSHCRASRIQQFFLSANHGNRQCFTVFHGPSTLKSIRPALFKTLLVLILIFSTTISFEFSPHLQNT